MLARPDERAFARREFVAHEIRKVADDVFEYVLSDATPDRLGDVIEPAGWQLTNFRKNPVALFGHDTSFIVGAWKNVRVVGDELRGELALLPPTSDRMREIHAAVGAGALRAVSVGFRPIKAEPLDEDEPFKGTHFLNQELIEASLVAVPANPRALQIAKQLNLSPQTLSLIFGKHAGKDGDQAGGATGKHAEAQTPNGANMTLSQKIQASEKRITGLRDQLAELAAKDDHDDEERKLTLEIPGMIKAEETELARYQNMEKAIAPRSPTPSPVERTETVPPERTFILPPRKKIEPVDHVFRAMAVSLKSFGTQTPIDTALREMYGQDEGTGWMIKAAVNPAQTTVAGYAADLVNTGYGTLMDRLMADSIYTPLAGAGSRFDFGRNGQIKIPVRSNTPRAAGAWVGEGAPKPVKKIALTQITLTPHKLAVITTFTEEMAFYSTPAIEGVLRKSMADDTREALDGFLIDNVAASATRPAGLLNGVTPLTPSGAATSIQKIVADINALIAPMEAAGGGGNVVLIMNPAEARKIGMAQTTTGDFAFSGPAEAASKFGVSQIISSTIVTAGTVIAVDADWFTTAVGDTPRFAVSTEATLHEEDTTPLPLGSGTQGSGVLAVPMRSLFQTDSVAIRLSLYVTWAMTRPGMVQVVPGVAW